MPTGLQTIRDSDGILTVPSTYTFSSFTSFFYFEPLSTNVYVTRLRENGHTHAVQTRVSDNAYIRPV